MAEVGIVVPTIWQRPEYLPLALASIRAAGEAYVLLVGKPGFDWQPLRDAGLIDQYLDEVDPNLAAKINYGFSSLPREVKYINWLGDDDLLKPDSLRIAAARLAEADQPVMVYGACEYIDENGKNIFLNSSGRWAVPLLRFGPQLIPQPGALYRRDAFEKVGGLKPIYGWAFDFDLFLELLKIGKLIYLPMTLSNFRWHSGSISVAKRRNSVGEASAVRISHLPKVVRPVSMIWELPVRLATLYAGNLLSKKLTGRRSV